LEVGILESGADVAAGELRDLFDGAFGGEPAAQERFNFVAVGGLEFKHGEPAAEARLEIFQGTVAGAEDDGAGRFVEVVQQGQQSALGGPGDKVAFLDPDRFVVGVEVAVGQASSHVLNPFEVDAGAVVFRDAEFGAAQHVVEEPASQAALPDAGTAVDQDGHGGVLVRTRLRDQSLDAARGGGRAEIAVADKVGDGAGNEF